MNINAFHPDALLSVVVPAFNEEKNIPQLLEALHHELSKTKLRTEIIIVDDGSADQTSEVANRSPFPARVITLSRNFGKENAITAGMSHAIGDAVIILDADLQHPPHLIHSFISAWSEGYDMVYGVRTDRADRSRLIRFSSSLFYRILEKSTAASIPPGAGDFRLMDRKVVDAILSLPEKDRFMKGIFAWVGFNSIAIPFSPVTRFSGDSKFNFFSLFSLALTGATSFTSLPLRLWTGVGFVISSCSFLYAAFIISRTLILGTDLPGWATLAVGVFFFSGLQLISIGILGEYIGRIFTEVKGRPSYIIAENRTNKNYSVTQTETTFK